MTSFRYKCKKCGSENIKKQPIFNKYRCKSCGERTETDLISSEGASEVEQKMADVQQQIAEEEAKKISFNVENVQTTLTEQPKSENSPVISSSNTEERVRAGVTETLKKNGFSEDTIKKYFEVVDKMMVGKTSEWDVTKKEEGLLGELWADYANEKFKEVPPETSKLLLASAATFTVYLPRIAMYVKKLYEQKHTEKKEEEPQEQPQDKPLSELMGTDGSAWADRKE